ncbi:MAG TPA: DNA replication/repair protein RecF [Chthonomonadaceae bacterium]|nr:DNA replication/repair protein RecF [Chthonomonadaceae bacterium]
MQVRQLKLSCFRNYRELTLVPGEGLNILHGANAQGKSNILEALSLLATTRSLRASRESELILRGAEMAHVIAEVDREREGEAELQVSVFQSDKKAVRINGLKRGRVVELLGQFNAVFFGSIDLAIVTGEPSQRRHYLNVEISQISPRYVYDLGHYKRVLEQRNRLLRDLRENPRTLAHSGLDAWNEQLIVHGAPLFEKRRFYIERLAPLADQIHRELTDGKEGLEIRYLPNIPLPPEFPVAPPVVRESTPEERYLAEAEENIDSAPGAATSAALPEAPESPLSGTEAIAAAFREQLGVLASDELRRGTTLIGPQRDDIAFLIDGAEARIYGSQGQQRTVALALKLAEFRLIEDYVGEPPVMLLDDVMSDLDDTRRGHLLAWIRRRCQTFLTCTNLRSFPKDILAEAATFKVVAGTVTPDGSRKLRTTTPIQPNESPPAEARNNGHYAAGEAAENAAPPEPAERPARRAAAGRRAGGPPPWPSPQEQGEGA